MPGVYPISPRRAGTSTRCRLRHLAASAAGLICAIAELLFKHIYSKMNFAANSAHRTARHPLWLERQAWCYRTGTSLVAASIDAVRRRDESRQTCLFRQAEAGVMMTVVETVNRVTTRRGDAGEVASAWR